MNEFKKISEIISIDDSGSDVIISVNGQWQFTLPDELSYGVNEEFSLIDGGIDLSGSMKPLVIKEDWSVYDQAFCAAVEEHFSFTGDHTTIIDCKYDNRFGDDNDMNSQTILIDEDDFYVDLTSVNTWPFGILAEIRVRGENMTPYNISMMVKPEEDDHWEHIADYFRDIAASICKTQQTAKKKSAPKKASSVISDPNCIMSGTVLQRYIGNDVDIILPEGITELADNIFSGKGNIRSIVIPEGVTRIGNRAFENCFQLQKVVLPESIVEIGAYAFVDCHNLESINLDGPLKSIESSVFSECFKLNNVTIPETVKYIDAFAFKNCSAFSKIVIPEGVTSIGFTAFANCTNLEYLYIPTSVIGIYDNLMQQTPFDRCNNLTIYCDEGAYAKEYADAHGIRCAYSTPPATAKTTKQKNVPSPSQQAKKQENTLYYYNDNRFHLKSDLEIPVPNGYHYEQYGSGLNQGWAYIVPQDVSLSENHIDAMPYSFAVTTSPISHHDFESANIEAYKQIFLSDGYLSSGVLVDSLVLSDHCAFLYQNWYDATENLYNKINGFLFAANDIYQFHIYANHTEPISQDKDTIAAFLEIGKEWMQQVVLYADIDETDPVVCEDGFSRDGSTLTSYYGSAADIIIPSNISTISESAFVFNRIIRSVDIPDSVTSIGASAFSNCDNLIKVSMTNNIAFIGEAAFFNCSKLKSIVLPECITTIASFTFNGCANLTALVIPNNVTEIGDYAFASCENLTDLVIPNSVTLINENTFYKVGKNLVLHVGVNSYAEKYAQEKGIKYDNEIPDADTLAVEINPDDPEMQNPFVFADNGKTLEKYIGSDTEAVVPDGTTEIAGFAFDSTSVTSVVLPDSIKQIGHYAFTSCTNLQQITIPTSVKTVENNAFMECSSLTEITWPGNVKTIPESVFEYCTALTTVVIEEGVTKIGASAFAFCDNLKDIFLPMSLSHIGDFFLLASGKPTLHVYSGSYAEKYAKTNNLSFEIQLTPEQEAEKKRQEEARRMAEETYAAELKVWEQACGEVETQREQRVSELLEEKRVELKTEAQSKYDAAIAAANKRKETAQQKKSDAEKRLSTLGVFKFAEKKEANTVIQEAENEIRTAETALNTAQQTLDKELAAIPATIHSQKPLIIKAVERKYPLPEKPKKPL